jgi:hypothetical protein
VADRRFAVYTRQSTEPRDWFSPCEAPFQTCLQFANAEAGGENKWIGHSITVSDKHYANSVPDELFERAAAIAEPATVDAERRNAPEKAPEQLAIPCDSAQDDEGAIAAFAGDTAGCGPVRKPPRGLEPLT